MSQEVSKAVKNLGLTEDQIKPLDFDSCRSLYSELVDWFVKSGDRRWWWEDFKAESFDFIESLKPFEQLNDIIPYSGKKVWLIVEDYQEDFYPIYDCQPSIISELIGECFGFEYYVIDKTKAWLICENHHNILMGLGT